MNNTKSWIWGICCCLAMGAFSSACNDGTNVFYPENGSANASCTEGAYSCNGQELRTCSNGALKVVKTCAAGETCNANTKSCDKGSTPQCTTNNDCASNQVCSGGSCVNSSSPNPGPCSSDSDCATGQICQNSACVVKNCDTGVSCNGSVLTICENNVKSTIDCSTMAASQDAPNGYICDADAEANKACSARKCTEGVRCDRDTLVVCENNVIVNSEDCAAKTGDSETGYACDSQSITTEACSVRTCTEGAKCDGDKLIICENNTQSEVVCSSEPSATAPNGLMCDDAAIERRGCSSRVCVEGAERCADDKVTPEVCKDNAWVAKGDACDSATQICEVSEQNVAECVSSGTECKKEKECRGTEIWNCENGSYSKDQDCGENEVCADDEDGVTCKPAECTTGDSRCNGELTAVETCTNSRWAVSSTCGEDEACAVSGTTASCVDSELVYGTPIYFSEYVLGTTSESGASVNNRALEIYNGTKEDLDLSKCVVNIYSDGGMNVNHVINLKVGEDTPTILGAGNVYVLCHRDFSTPALCNQLYSRVLFDGNDVVELVCDGKVLDIFGQIGDDSVWEGTSENGSIVRSKDMSLRRKCDINAGDTNGTDAFDPAKEWLAGDKDDLSNLGHRNVDCCERGTVKCENVTVEEVEVARNFTCNSSNEWEADAELCAADYTCHNPGTVGETCSSDIQKECNAGEVICRIDNNVSTNYKCNDEGQWVVDAPCEGGWVCADQNLIGHVCILGCTEDDIKCDVVENVPTDFLCTCNNSICTWQVVSACKADQICEDPGVVGTECVSNSTMDCSPGTNICEVNGSGIAETKNCDGFGHWTDPVQCELGCRKDGLCNACTTNLGCADDNLSIQLCDDGFVETIPCYNGCLAGHAACNECLEDKDCADGKSCIDGECKEKAECDISVCAKDGDKSMLTVCKNGKLATPVECENGCNEQGTDCATGVYCNFQSIDHKKYVNFNDATAYGRVTNDITVTGGGLYCTTDLSQPVSKWAYGDKPAKNEAFSDSGVNEWMAGAIYNGTSALSDGKNYCTFVAKFKSGENTVTYACMPNNHDDTKTLPEALPVSANLYLTESQTRTVFNSCGDGRIDEGEQCDGEDLGNKTCADLIKGTKGDLKCNGCFFNTISCVPETEPEWTYKETFSDISLTTSYTSGDYKSSDIKGVTWSYTNAINTTSKTTSPYAIDEAGVLINNGGLIGAAPTGIGSIAVDVRKAYTAKGDRVVSVYLGGSKSPCNTITWDDTDVHTVYCLDVNLDGKKDIQITSTGKQATIDNIRWTEYK